MFIHYPLDSGNVGRPLGQKSLFEVKDS